MQKSRKINRLQNIDTTPKEGESLNESKPKKDSPVLVVIPQITSSPKDLSEGKSGFFSKKYVYPMRTASSKVT